MATRRPPVNRRRYTSVLEQGDWGVLSRESGFSFESPRKRDMENTWDNEIEIGLMRNFANALHPFPHIQALCSPDICPLQTLQSSLREESVSHRAIFGFVVLG